MSIDFSLRDRVATHAALADETRLRIVEHLDAGDATPSELQAMLAISSNLMAHHVGMLERAGLVTRHRSEADRRRAYLHLVPEALEGLLPPLGVRTVPRVVFVCTANSARSQLAAALWSGSSDVPVASAGTHPAATIAEGAIATARRHGLVLASAEPRPLAEVVRADDFVVTVCDTAHEELDRGHGRAEVVRSLHWSVPDPVAAGSAAAFDAAYDDLHRRVTRLAPRLTAQSA